MTRPNPGRSALVAQVLDAVTLLSSGLTARRVPFHGRSLTGTQLRTLHHLAHARTPMTPGRLAAVLGVTAGAVTQLVDALQTDGLVEVAPHPGDARSRVLALTPAAREEVADFENGVTEAALPRFDALSDAELKNLAALLARVDDTV